MRGRGGEGRGRGGWRGRGVGMGSRRGGAGGGGAGIGAALRACRCTAGWSAVSGLPPAGTKCLAGGPEAHSACASRCAPWVQEVAAYEAALARLEAEGVRPLEEAAFQQQVAQAQEELRRER